MTSESGEQAESAASTDEPDISTTSSTTPRVKIGSQRPTAPAEPLPILTAKPQPMAPTNLNPEAKAAERPKAAKHYPPPNIRAQLTPDLEMEFAEAIGGIAIDEMLTSASPAAAELEPESTVTGRVLSIGRDTVFVDLGGQRQGSIKLLSMTESPQPGDPITAIVSRFNHDEGLYELTLPGKAAEVGDWSQVSEGMLVDVRVTGHNKGGLECEVSQLRGFIPASQVSMYRVDELSQFVGERFTCIVTEVNPEKRNLVLSRRAVLEREKAAAKENLMATLEVGQTHEGIVRSLQNFGAFVDLGGVDGLIHISQLSWDRIRHASEVLEVGQKVKVKVQKIDPETGKIGLAFRDLAENPWSNVVSKYLPRSRVNGTVSRITEFGAFVRLEPGIEGLIHISELAHKRVHRAGDIVKEGQEVEVQIVSVDPENQRIGLSLKALEARPEPAKQEEPEEEAVAPEPISNKPRNVPLKGGVGKQTGGEQFGLKW